MIIPDTFMFEYDTAARSYVTKKMSSASANAAIFGVPKMFVPRWNWWWNWDKNMLLKADAEQGKMEQQQQLQYLFDPRSWTYLYDHSPLAKTLDKYIDYKKLNLAATQEDLPSVLRLI
jgi:NTE family protein